ncbi:hypothetical protein GMMP1_220023 [Candidatus Magnetomoraceae bacterium gMMP-1]
MAMVNGTWGTITALSKKFMISRIFVYMLAYQLEQTNYIIFGDNKLKPSVIKEDYAYHYILSWFDISAVKRDLGYKSRISIEKGLKYLEEWLK